VRTVIVGMEVEMEVEAVVVGIVIGIMGVEVDLLGGYTVIHSTHCSSS
jgi:hypothetical protein